MNILYIILFSILYVIVIVGLKYLAMTITNSEGTIKCPKCGSNMDYIYSDNNLVIFNELPNQLKHYYYKCPKCGKIIII